jgi:hypothetical protein
MTTRGPGIGEVCGNRVSKTADGFRRKDKLKEKTYVLPNFILGTINLPTVASACFPTTSKYHCKSSRIEGLPVYLWDFDSQRAIAQETRWSYVGRIRSRPGKPFTVEVSVLGRGDCRTGARSSVGGLQ